MPTRLSVSPVLNRRVRRLAAGALVAAALPLAGCGGGGGGGSKGDGGADPASVVPATSAFYGEVTVRPEGDLKASVEALAKKIAKTDNPGDQLTKLLDNAIDSDGVTYSKDIDPWLGKKVGVAITGLRNPSSPDFAVVLDATDTKKALDSLKKGKDKVEDRKYKDVTYAYNKDVDEAAVTTGGTLVIGTEPAVKAVIDVSKGAASLGKSPKLAKARSSVTKDGLGFFYVDPVAVIDLASAASPALGGQVGSLKSLLGNGKSSALGAALTATPNAIRLETAVDGQAANSAANDAAETVKTLPKGAVLAAGFGNIGGRAKEGVTALNGLGGIFSGVLSQFKLVTGLDLEQDVLSWMGKGGLFVRANGLADIGGALVVESSNDAKSARFVAAAERLLNQFGSGLGVSAKAYRSSGAKGFEVRIPSFPFPVIVASGSGKFVVAVGESSVQEALKPTGSLGDDPTFKATAASLGAQPALYIDVKTIVDFLSLAVGSDESFKTAKPYLDAFTAIAAGSERSGSTSKASVVVGVK